MRNLSPPKQIPPLRPFSSLRLSIIKAPGAPAWSPAESREQRAEIRVIKKRGKEKERREGEKQPKPSPIRLLAHPSRKSIQYNILTLTLALTSPHIAHRTSHIASRIAHRQQRSDARDARCGLLTGFCFCLLSATCPSLGAHPSPVSHPLTLPALSINTLLYDARYHALRRHDHIFILILHFYFYISIFPVLKARAYVTRTPIIDPRCLTSSSVRDRKFRYFCSSFSTPVSPFRNKTASRRHEGA